MPSDKISKADDDQEDHETHEKAPQPDPVVNATAATEEQPEPEATAANPQDAAANPGSPSPTPEEAAEREKITGTVSGLRDLETDKVIGVEKPGINDKDEAGKTGQKATVEYWDELADKQKKQNAKTRAAIVGKSIIVGLIADDRSRGAFKLDRAVDTAFSGLSRFIGAMLTGNPMSVASAAWFGAIANLESFGNGVDSIRHRTLQEYGIQDEIEAEQMKETLAGRAAAEAYQKRNENGVRMLSTLVELAMDHAKFPENPEEIRAQAARESWRAYDALMAPASGFTSNEKAHLNELSRQCASFSSAKEFRKSLPPEDQTLIDRAGAVIAGRGDIGDEGGEVFFENFVDFYGSGERTTEKDDDYVSDFQYGTQCTMGRMAQCRIAYNLALLEKTAQLRDMENGYTLDDAGNEVEYLGPNSEIDRQCVRDDIKLLREVITKLDAGLVNIDPVYAAVSAQCEGEYNEELARLEKDSEDVAVVNAKETPAYKALLGTRTRTKPRLVTRKAADNTEFDLPPADARISGRPIVDYIEQECKNLKVMLGDGCYSDQSYITLANLGACIQARKEFTEQYDYLMEHPEVPRAELEAASKRFDDVLRAHPWRNYGREDLIAYVPYEAQNLDAWKLDLAAKYHLDPHVSIVERKNRSAFDKIFRDKLAGGEKKIRKDLQIRFSGIPGSNAFFIEVNGRPWKGMLSSDKHVEELYSTLRNQYDAGTISEDDKQLYMFLNVARAWAARNETYLRMKRQLENGRIGSLPGHGWHINKREYLDDVLRNWCFVQGEGCKDWKSMQDIVEGRFDLDKDLIDLEDATFEEDLEKCKTEAELINFLKTKHVYADKAIVQEWLNTVNDCPEKKVIRKFLSGDRFHDRLITNPKSTKFKSRNNLVFAEIGSVLNAYHELFEREGNLGQISSAHKYAGVKGYAEHEIKAWIRDIIEDSFYNKKKGKIESFKDISPEFIQQFGNFGKLSRLRDMELNQRGRGRGRGMSPDDLEESRDRMLTTIVDNIFKKVQWDDDSDGASETGKMLSGYDKWRKLAEAQDADPRTTLKVSGSILSAAEGGLPIKMYDALMGSKRGNGSKILSIGGLPVWGGANNVDWPTTDSIQHIINALANIANSDDPQYDALDRTEFEKYALIYSNIQTLLGLNIDNYTGVTFDAAAHLIRKHGGFKSAEALEEFLKANPDLDATFSAPKGRSNVDWRNRNADAQNAVHVDDTPNAILEQLLNAMLAMQGRLNVPDPSGARGQTESAEDEPAEEDAETEEPVEDGESAEEAQTDGEGQSAMGSPKPPDSSGAWTVEYYDHRSIQAIHFDQKNNGAIQDVVEEVADINPRGKVDEKGGSTLALVPRPNTSADVKDSDCWTYDPIGNGGKPVGLPAWVRDYLSIKRKISTASPEDRVKAQAEAKDFLRKIILGQSSYVIDLHGPMFEMKSGLGDRQINTEFLYFGKNYGVKEIADIERRVENFYDMGRVMYDLLMEVEAMEADKVIGRLRTEGKDSVGVLDENGRLVTQVKMTDGMDKLSRFEVLLYVESELRSIIHNMEEKGAISIGALDPDLLPKWRSDRDDDSRLDLMSRTFLKGDDPKDHTKYYGFVEDICRTLIHNYGVSATHTIDFLYNALLSDPDTKFKEYVDGSGLGSMPEVGDQPDDQQGDLGTKRFKYQKDAIQGYVNDIIANIHDSSVTQSGDRLNMRWAGMRVLCDALQWRLNTGEYVKGDRGMILPFKNKHGDSWDMDPAARWMRGVAGNIQSLLDSEVKLFGRLADGTPMCAETENHHFVVLTKEGGNYISAKRLLDGDYRDGVCRFMGIHPYIERVQAGGKLVTMARNYLNAVGNLIQYRNELFRDADESSVHGSGKTAVIGKKTVNRDEVGLPDRAYGVLYSDPSKQTNTAKELDMFREELIRRGLCEAVENSNIQVSRKPKGKGKSKADMEGKPRSEMTPDEKRAKKDQTTQVQRVKDQAHDRFLDDCYAKSNIEGERCLEELRASFKNALPEVADKLTKEAYLAAKLKNKGLTLEGYIQSILKDQLTSTFGLSAHDATLVIGGSMGLKDFITKASDGILGDSLKILGDSNKGLESNPIYNLSQKGSFGSEGDVRDPAILAATFISSLLFRKFKGQSRDAVTQKALIGLIEYVSEEFDGKIVDDDASYKTLTEIGNYVHNLIYSEFTYEDGSARNEKTIKKEGLASDKEAAALAKFRAVTTLVEALRVFPPGQSRSSRRAILPNPGIRQAKGMITDNGAVDYIPSGKAGRLKGVYKEYLRINNTAMNESKGEKGYVPVAEDSSKEVSLDNLILTDPYILGAAVWIASSFYKAQTESTSQGRSGVASTVTQRIMNTKLDDSAIYQKLSNDRLYCALSRGAVKRSWAATFDGANNPGIQKLIADAYVRNQVRNILMTCTTKSDDVGGDKILDNIEKNADPQAADMVTYGAGVRAFINLVSSNLTPTALNNLRHILLKSSVIEDAVKQYGPEVIYGIIAGAAPAYSAVADGEADFGGLDGEGEYDRPAGQSAGAVENIFDKFPSNAPVRDSLGQKVIVPGLIPYIRYDVEKMEGESEVDAQERALASGDAVMILGQLVSDSAAELLGRLSAAIDAYSLLKHHTSGGIGNTAETSEMTDVEETDSDAGEAKERSNPKAVFSPSRGIVCGQSLIGKKLDEISVNVNGEIVKFEGPGTTLLLGSGTGIGTDKDFRYYFTVQEYNGQEYAWIIPLGLKNTVRSKKEAGELGWFYVARVEDGVIQGGFEDESKNNLGIPGTLVVDMRHGGKKSAHGWPKFTIRRKKFSEMRGRNVPKISIVKSGSSESNFKVRYVDMPLVKLKNNRTLRPKK